MGKTATETLKKNEKNRWISESCVRGSQGYNNNKIVN